MTPATRIPLNTLAVAFGLAGLAGVWSLAAADLGVPVIIAEFFWIVAAVAWVWLVTAHTVRGYRSPDRLIDQLRHPVQGPIAALFPVVAMLLGAHYYAYAPQIGLWIVVLAMLASAAFAGWLIGRWITGGIEPDAIHGGYFLPTVAAGFVAATAAAKVGLSTIAIGAFTVGAFFWVVIFIILLARLALRPHLPAPLVPTLAIIVAPPAVGGTAWLTITGSEVGAIDYSLAALTVLMVLVQLAVVRSYLALRFSLGFWSFTFSFAAVCGYGIEWLALERPGGWQVVSWVIVASITVFIIAVAAQSVRLALGAAVPLVGLRKAEGELSAADNQAALAASSASGGSATGR